ncbi:hypothetical protein VPH35_123256 [Triticum aestivum]
MSYWGVLWPMQHSDSVLLSITIAVEQLHFKTGEELRSQPGEAPELPACGGGAGGRKGQSCDGWLHSAVPRSCGVSQEKRRSCLPVVAVRAGGRAKAAMGGCTRREVPQLQ